MRLMLREWGITTVWSLVMHKTQLGISASRVSHEEATFPTFLSNLIILFCISYIVASKCLLRMPPYRRLSAHKSSYRVRNHRSFQWYRYRLVCCRFFKGCISFSLIYCVILLQLWCILTTYNFHSINRRGWWIPARKRSQCRCILVAGKETISRRRICGKSILNLDF